MRMAAGRASGFGSANAMRGVFQRTLKTTPGQYRQRFKSLHAVKRQERARNNLS